MKAKNPALLLASALLLSSCQTTVDNQTSLEATWKYALVSIPEGMTTDGSRCVGSFASNKNRKCLEKISRDRKHPLVLFMHGCAGIRDLHRRIITNFRSLGYAVIAPDSYARLGRKADCKPFGRKRFTISLRADEIRYALTQIPKLDWVDRSRLVLAGFSEGGNTVAEYGGEDAFVGYIVMGWDCRYGLSPSGPVLAIQGARDPQKKGRCSVVFRENSDSITVPKAKHDISSYPETMAALRKFLGAVVPVE
jgi:dienelactone hydrolase